MKAEDFSVAETSDRASFVRAVKSVRRIKQQLEPSSFSNLRQAIDLAWSSPKMHTENSRGARSDQLFHLSRIDAVCLSIDIAEDGCDPLPLKRVRSCDERKRGNDDFTL